MIVRACLLAAALFAVGCPASSSASSSSPAAPEKCPHGVDKPLCARCNPALKPAFVAQKDWCVEHERPESQCVLCHPELAQKGIR